MKKPLGSPHVHSEPLFRQLTVKTWLDLERLFAANNGVWGDAGACSTTGSGPSILATTEGTREKSTVSSVWEKPTGPLRIAGRNPLGGANSDPKRNCPV